MHIGRVGPPAQLANLFEEEFYLRSYADVAKAVAEGRRESGWDHYRTHGYAEGRHGFRFDSLWYLNAYPVAALEIRSGVAATPQEHFALFGVARGYLPERAAPRPDDAARLGQRFGGLWIDAPDAHDLIEGRLEIGSITQLEADSLRAFREQGYVVLPSAISPALVERARTVLEAAYEGRYPDLKFECHAVSRESVPWRPEMNDVPSKALDIHMFSPVLRDVMFADRVRRFLNLIFECQPFASQTLGFLRGSAQEAHQDSAYVAYTIPRRFAASWVALEDVSPEAGELFYYPGSHRFEDFVYGGGYKSVSEAKRAGADPETLSAEILEHVGLLRVRAEARAMRQEVFMARAGDALIWHADLAHGGLPVSRDITRRSLVTHYCPRFLAPLFMEDGARGYFPHHSGGVFTSGAYPGRPPSD